MSLLILREEMSDIYSDRTKIQFQLVGKYCCVVLGFVLAVSRVCNRCLWPVLQKLLTTLATGNDEVTGEIIKGGGDKVVDWIWRLCNITIESGKVPEDWRFAMIVPLYKSKGERTECSNYRGISLSSVVSKIYAGILVDSS